MYQLQVTPPFASLNLSSARHLTRVISLMVAIQRQSGSHASHLIIGDQRYSHYFRPTGVYNRTRFMVKGTKGTTVSIIISVTGQVI